MAEEEGGEEINIKGVIRYRVQAALSIQAYDTQTGANIQLTLHRDICVSSLAKLLYILTETGKLIDIKHENVKVPETGESDA